MQNLSDQIEQGKNNKRLQDFISKGLIAGKDEHAMPGQSADEPSRNEFKRQTPAATDPREKKKKTRVDKMVQTNEQGDMRVVFKMFRE